MLSAFEILPSTNNTNSFTLAVSVVGILATSFSYKIKREKLHTALYLIDLKAEIEKLKQ